MISLRAIEQSDIVQIVQLDNEVNPSPWDEKTLSDLIKAGYKGWVIVEEKNVLGFCLISLSADECQIVNLAVKPNRQQQGLGTQLMEQAVKYAVEQGAKKNFLEVRKSNTNAQQLYKKLGFTPIAIRKDYYKTKDGHEDAIIMSENL